MSGSNREAAGHSFHVMGLLYQACDRMESNHDKSNGYGDDQRRNTNIDIRFFVCQSANRKQRDDGAVMGHRIHAAGSERHAAQDGWQR